MARYDAILFDFDGVLVDSEPVHYACWAEILRPYGIELTWDLYAREFVGLTDSALLDILGSRANPPVPGAKLREHFPRKKEMFRERMLADPPADPDLVNLIKSLNHYKLAVVTSSTRRESGAVLERLGLRDYFHAMVFGEDVSRHKPDPEPYLLAAKLLSARKPLVVEDSDAGVASARAAGFDVIRVAHASQTANALRAALASE
ncbi:MAG TPA: HAD family phosphatase [Bryobacteraceae bacterium]|nr:HAD family phosphatase [Bryobacteraceae bacterium]HOL73008.1 HAD family phosphatase [Bryobacteraceae bacterium]HOQ46375.1 HAD family phosphatase [Bryobacteraceae bacterium]HPQ16003.1 HAD family phosphatase [Bryobacteraceae bacterium]HPU72188.1 HAD family phosphatase [Bryobacteraceae bacterium]